MEQERTACSQSPGHRPERGWSLDHLRTGSSVVAITFALVATIVGPATALAAGYDPAADFTSMANVTRYTGAQAWWADGFTGQGVDIALIDTGVAPVTGLDGADKVIYGPDLSLESQAPNLTNLDTNGHGTFMAGLIAANSADYTGIAPDARIVSLKVATADGGADVSQVIAAIDWVVQHKNDNGLNIRILNLSYGTNSLQDSEADPLSYAVEQAWNAGIVVVAAAGNTGYQRGKGAPGLADPAYNPFVFGVGGYDPGSRDIPNDDFMGDYSASSAGCGSKCKNPDIVAVGSHLQGLRVPNSYVDATHPEGRINDRFFRGSGTSEAAAILSGSLALILQKYPSLDPDSLKRFVMSNAKKVPGADSQAQGAGEISLSTLQSKHPSDYVQKFHPSKGGGKLEDARGADHLTRDGVVLEGEVDVFGQPFVAKEMALAEAAGSSWSGGTWNGSSWSGSSWSGSSWSGSSWSGSSWSGSSWSGSSWSGSSWSGSSWSGSSWSGSSWSGSSWSGGSWATGSWD